MGSINGLPESTTEPGVAIELGYDYGEVTERDRKLVNEFLLLLDQRRSVPIDMIITELRQKFEIENIPMLKIEDTLWHKYTKDERIGGQIQGFRMTTDENGKKYKVPHWSFSADIDYLDDFLKRVAKQLVKDKVIQK